MLASTIVSRFGIEGRWLTGGPPSGQRYVRGLLSALGQGPALGARSVVVFCTNRRVSTPPGCDIRVLPRTPAPIFSGVSVQLAMPGDVSAVLYQSFTPPFSRAGRVVVVHDLIYLKRPELFTPKERLYLSWIPRLLPLAEVIAAVSEHVREEVLEILPRRDPATVCVIPNGIDEAFFLDDSGRSSAEARVRQALGLGRPYIVAVGRINPRKNLARLVRAFLSARMSEHDLVLAGPRDGPSDDELATALRLAGDRVRLLGYVPDAILPGLYAGADAACYVSLDEGFGVPPLEAMATGTPVVASDIPALREVVGGAALLINPLEVEGIAWALSEIISDSALRRRLSADGRERASAYRWTEAATRAAAALELAATARGRWH